LKQETLVKELSRLVGREKVKGSIDWRLSYAYDGTPTGYKGIPDAVVFPEKGRCENPEFCQ